MTDETQFEVRIKCGKLARAIAEANRGNSNFIGASASNDGSHVVVRIQGEREKIVGPDIAWGVRVRYIDQSLQNSGDWIA